MEFIGKLVLLAMIGLWASDYVMAQKPSLVAQTMHSSYIQAIAISPDGKVIASGSNDTTVKLWEAATGRLLRTLSGHSITVMSVAFSPDGKVIASGSYDETIKLWETTTGRLLRTLSGHTGSVECIAFSPDGKVIVSWSRDRTIKLWDVTNGRELRMLSDNSMYVTSIAFSPDGKIIASDGDETIRLWDAATGLLLRGLSGHSGDVKSVKFSPDGKVLASLGADKTIRLWEVATGSEIRAISGPIEGFVSFAFIPDGKVIANSSDLNSIKLLDVTTGLIAHTFPNHPGPIRSIAFSPNGRFIAIGDGTIKLLEAATGRELRAISNHSSRPLSIAFSSDGKVLASSDGDSAIKLMDVTTGRLLRTLSGHSGRILSVAFSPVGKVVASGSFDRTVKLWDATNGRELRTLSHGYHEVKSIAFSPDGKVLASAGFDKTIKLWETATGRELRSLAGHFGEVDGVLSVAFSPDGKVVASSGFDKTIKLSEASTGRQLRTLSGHSDWIFSVAFSPDGKVIASGSSDNTVKLWEAATGRELRTLSGHSNGVQSVRFSPDGEIIASGSFDHTVTLWQATTGQKLRTLIGHSSHITSIAFSHDGKILASSSDDASVKLWRVTTGELFATWFSFDSDEWALADPEGRFDASPGGMKYLHYVSGLTTIALEELKERYYEPGLLSKILGYNREPLRNVAAFNEIKLAPEAQLQPITPGSSQLNIVLVNRGGGIGRAQVFVNNSLLTEDARQGRQINPNVQRATVTVDLSKAANRKPGEANLVRVVTWNNENFISSPGVETEWVAPGAVESGEPVLYGIFGGVSNYSGDQRMNLRFSAIDARTMAEAVRLAASRLLGVHKVRITLLASGALPSASAGSTGFKELEPTKTNFMTAFEAIARQARPTDILVVFLAGHGVSLASGASEYAYLTKEARTLDKNVLADPEILRLNAITSDELKEFVTKIPANKRVLILDTCEAGAASTDLAMARNLPGDQIRALDRLKDRTGFYVLMGAASSKASYETSSYGQGLLTYSLLKGIKGAALRDEKFVDVLRLFAYAQDEAPRLAQVSGGAQQPHFMAKEGATFDIGMLLPEDREQIKLAQSKPLILPPQLFQEGVGYDSLDLSKAFRERLREASAANQINAVLLSADDYPGAVRLTGTYQVTGAKVRVLLAIRKNQQSVGNAIVEGDKSDVAGLAQKLMDALNNVIEKLLPQ